MIAMARTRSRRWWRRHPGDPSPPLDSRVGTLFGLRPSALGGMPAEPWHARLARAWAGQPHRQTTMPAAGAARQLTRAVDRVVDHVVQLSRDLTDLEASAAQEGLEQLAFLGRLDRILTAAESAAVHALLDRLCPVVGLPGEIEVERVCGALSRADNTVLSAVVAQLVPQQLDSPVSRREFTRRRPPPVQLRALTTSTLTAAPPAVRVRAIPAA